MTPFAQFPKPFSSQTASQLELRHCASDGNHLEHPQKVCLIGMRHVAQVLQVDCLPDESPQLADDWLGQLRFELAQVSSPRDDWLAISPSGLTRHILGRDVPRHLV